MIVLAYIGIIAAGFTAIALIQKSVEAYRRDGSINQYTGRNETLGDVLVVIYGVASLVGLVSAALILMGVIR